MAAGNRAELLDSRGKLHDEAFWGGARSDRQSLENGQTAREYEKEKSYRC